MSAAGDGEGQEGLGAQPAELAALRSSLTQSDQLLHELRVHQIELEIQNRALVEVQHQLESSRERYVQLFESAPIAYLRLEVDGRIIELNVAAERLLGQERTAVLGRRLQTVVGLSDPIAFRNVLHRSIEQECEIRTEMSFRTTAQQNVTADVIVLPMLKGSEAGQLRVAFHDVTARATAEHNLRFLSQAGARLTRIPLGAPQMLDEIAAAGALGSVDGCWVEVDGVESAAWRTEPLRRRLVGEALQVLRLHIAPTIREATARVASVPGGWKDDQKAPPLWTVVRSWMSAPLLVQGKVRGTITLFQEFSPETEEAAIALTEEFARRVSTLLDNDVLLRRAEEASRARDEMLAVLAHDLSNALFSFRLHTQRGLSRGGEHAVRALGAVARGSQWLLGLVKTVLDLAGTEGGPLKVQPQPGDLSPVLESACELQQLDADERRVHVERTWPDQLTLKFDQERILQVLFNLMNNAVKFTPVDGCIVVGASQEGDHVHIWVQDSGKGLGPGQSDRVFERGWQADPKAGGKGLGLYISRRIVEAHGGKMWVESTPGRGSTFHVVLPSAVAETASRQDEAAVSP